MSTHSESLIECLRDAVARHAMFSPEDAVLVAVSGGADSVCLLHTLIECGVSTAVAHLDHGTRDGASAADAAFVRDLAQRWQLPFYGAHRCVKQEAATTPHSFEAYARKVRYEFLLETARAHGYFAIATGHTADDQAETVLMRILRGTSPQGLGGIPPVRVQDGVRIVRPLIGCTRNDILAYLAARDLPFREDQSNGDPAFVRNRVRHTLLPRLRAEFNPAVDEALRRLAESQRVENGLLEHLAQNLVAACIDATGAIRRAEFRAHHEAVQRRALARLAIAHGATPDYAAMIGAAAFIRTGPAGKSFDLGSGLLLRNSRNHTEFVSRNPEPMNDIPTALAAPGKTAAFDWVFDARYLEQPLGVDLRTYCTSQRQVFDADALGDCVTARRRRPGDRFQPLGMKGTRTLKDYLMDLHLPAGQRREQLVIEGACGIAWVIGHAIDRRAAVTPTTRRVLEIEAHHATE